MINKENVTLLYVDDEDVNLFLFRKSFQNKYKILTAKSGSSGIKQLEAHANEILVVISDMRMPGMNGVEFVRQARENYDNIIYFILTGFEFNDEISKALKDRVIHKYFTKPFDMDEITEAIEEGLVNIK